MQPDRHELKAAEFFLEATEIDVEAGRLPDGCIISIAILIMVVLFSIGWAVYRWRSTVDGGRPAAVRIRSLSVG